MEANQEHQPGFSLACATDGKGRTAPTSSDSFIQFIDPEPNPETEGTGRIFNDDDHLPEEAFESADEGEFEDAIAYQHATVDEHSTKATTVLLSDSTSGTFHTAASKDGPVAPLSHGGSLESSNAGGFDQAATAGDQGEQGGDDIISEELHPQLHLSPEQEAEMLARADALKGEGNTLYAMGQSAEAIAKYREALAAAPPNAPQQAVYHANIAACHMREKRWEEAVAACNAALEVDPRYVKALMRRSQALEELQDPDHALADAQAVQSLDPSNAWAARSAPRLASLAAARHEALKEEMLGKLKDLGNTVLGKFGLSLDNFKAEKDPVSGNYSISFKQ